VKGPVVLGARHDGNTLAFFCENKRRTDRDIPESNGIGLRTCKKMMEEMGGGLTFGEVDGIFKVTVILPVGENDDKSDS